MLKQLQSLFSRVKPVPEEWFKEETNGTTEISDGPNPLRLECLPCESYTELSAAWREAMVWTDPLEIGLSTMLSAVVSTKLQDDQLWIRAIAKAGTAKTTLCEAIAINGTYTHPMSVLTGLHSGYKEPGAEGKDTSLIPKINGKTAIINEGDVLMKAPNRDQIMSELRDLYSGVARCHYRNGKQVEYLGIRCTVILAGTPTLRQLNKSALGDRFLDCIIYKQESIANERNLVRKILATTRLSSLCESNGEATSLYSPEKVRAYQLTGGYVDWLRANVIERLRELEASGNILDSLEGDCESLGLLVAIMRTRPGGGDEDTTEAELHVRLSKQLRKLALCTAVVLQTPLDREVMRRVANVAQDTCYGITFDVAKALLGNPMDKRGLALRLGYTDEKVTKALNILQSLGCVRINEGQAISGAFRRQAQIYNLTPHIIALLTKLKILLGVERL